MWVPGTDKGAVPRTASWDLLRDSWAWGGPESKHDWRSTILPVIPVHLRLGRNTSPVMSLPRGDCPKAACSSDVLIRAPQMGVCWFQSLVRTGLR